MVLNSIEKLLEKYENGETSLKEEQVLKNYFQSDNVAPHLEMYKPMFDYFLVNKEEQFTKDVPLKPKKTYLYQWISVAAVVVLLLGVYFGTSTNRQDLGTYDDPQLAFNAFSKSMNMVSEKFNKGASTVGYLEEVNKGTATLGYLNELENSTQIIFKK